MQDNSILEFSRVTKSYAETGNAIDSITMNIEKSAFCYLTGHSGAGKSTLLKLIIGMEKPNTGILLFNKRNISSITPSQLQQLRRKIGFVFQQPKLIEYLTVHENVAIALQSSGYTKQDIQDRTYAALRLVQLEHRAKSMPNALSGGEQQRVSIARAVANLPSLILADEPTGNLDEQLKRNILELFAKIHQNKCTVLLATHDISLMRHYPGRHISLSMGKIQIDSATQLQTQT